MIRCVQLLVAVTCTTIWATAGLTQPTDVNIEVSACIPLESELERFACYERLTADALPQPAQPGLAADRADTNAGRSRDADEPEEIRSSITALTERRPNEFVVTLENGQTWRQSIAKRYPLRMGQEVRVYSTRWGDSYRLSAAESNGYIQVERIE